MSIAIKIKMVRLGRELPGRADVPSPLCPAHSRHMLESYKLSSVRHKFQCFTSSKYQPPGNKCIYQKYFGRNNRKPSLHYGVDSVTPPPAAHIITRAEHIQPHITSASSQE